MKYAAFLSYARADDKLASWLHRKIDGYSAPKALVGTTGAHGLVPPKLFPIYRDRTDQQSGGSLSAQLETALAASENLIVLCTPSSAKSKWVNSEVEAFIRLGKSSRIFPVIGDGVASTTDLETTCYPPALRGMGILAADLREDRKDDKALVGDGREGGRLKLIAGLLGVPLNSLVRRERGRQRRLVAGLGAAVALFAVVAGVALVQSARATEERRVADEQRVIAETRRAEAVNTLRRFFATSSFESLKSGDGPAAARFALAGMSLAPSNAAEYRDALSAAHFAFPLPARIANTGGGVAAVAVAPNGGAIVSGDSKGAFTLWALPDLTPRTTVAAHKKWIADIAISPDSTQFATASGDHMIRIWNLADGSALRTLTGHSDTLVQVKYLPGGRLLSVGYDAICIWSATSGELLVRIPASVTLEEMMGVSPDGNIVIAQVTDDSFRDEIRAWSTVDGRELFRTATRYGQLSDISFSPDGSAFATAGEYGDVQVWSSSSGAMIGEVRHGGMWVRTARFSHDGAALVTAGDDGFIRVWSTYGFSKVRDIAGLGEYLRDAEFADDDRRIIAVSRGRAVGIWDRETGALLGELGGHRSDITGMVLTRRGTELVTSSQDGTIRISPLPRPRHRTLYDTEWVTDAGFSRSGSVALATTMYNSALLVDVDSGVVKTSFAGVQDLDTGVVSPDGRLVAVADNYKPVVSLLDAASGRILRQMKVAVSPDAFTGYQNLDFSPDGERLIGSGTDDAIFQWNTRDGSQTPGSPAESSYVMQVRYSPDGRYVASVGIRNGVEIRSASDLKLVRTISGHTSPTYSVAFSPDSKRLATGSTDRTAKVWDVETGSLVATMTGHRGQVNAVAFSPDGTRMATASEDKLVKVWSSASGTELATLDAHTDGVTTVAFSPDGKTLLSGSRDKRVLAWDVTMLTADWPTLAHSACDLWLGAVGRRFSAFEISGSPILRSEWPDPSRDVCENAGATATVR